VLFALTVIMARWRRASVLQRRTAAPLVWAGGLTLEAVMVSAVNDALSHPLGQALQAAVRGARDGSGRHGARAAAAADRWLLARANLTRPDTDAIVQDHRRLGRRASSGPSRTEDLLSRLTSTGQCTTPDVPHRLIPSGRCRANAVGRSSSAPGGARVEPVDQLGEFFGISCRFRGWCHRPGRGGQRPARASMARAMTAQGEW